jgi:hypothetical protein
VAYVRACRFAELHRVVVIFVNITLDRKPDLASMQRVFGAQPLSVTARCKRSVTAFLQQSVLFRVANCRRSACVISALPLCGAAN